MSSGKKSKTDISRRNFITTTGLAIGAMVLPSSMYGLGFSQKTAKYTRANLTSAEGQKALASYAKGIKKMLELPPTDPRNWYRNAMIHIMDCPHGNFWFLPWHRGYIGWFEQTIRDLSGDPDFALPYWDWTALPKIPASMFEGVLTPSNSSYYVDYDAFIKDFKGPINEFWKTLTPAQLNQLSLRHGGITSANKLISFIKNNWLPRSNARSLSAQHPGFDPTTQKAVSISTIEHALAPKTFIDGSGGPGFGSKVAMQHSMGPGFDILEGQPHNLVHNDVGGFMGEFMSPVDPIFFMHHCNIDRLWDVWTRKQVSLGLPTTPEGATLAKWNNESFLFYINNDGNTVTQNKSKDYTTIGQFDYQYTAGSGESVITTSIPIAANFSSLSIPVKRVKKIKRKTSAGGNVEFPEDLFKELKEGQKIPLYVAVTVKVPNNTEGVHYHVLLDVEKKDDFVDFDSPNYVGTFAFFGKMPHHAGHLFTFHLALNDALTKLDKVQKIDLNKLNVRVVMDRDGIALRDSKAMIQSIKIGTL